MARVPAGAASSRSRRLAANTRIASSSATCRNRIRRSMPRCTRIFVRQAQRTVSTSHLSAGRPWLSTPTLRAMVVSYSVGPSTSTPAGSGSMVIVSTSSFSPRNSARIRCDGIFVNGSSKSK